MTSIAIEDFPPNEVRVFRKICEKHSFDPGSFTIYAKIPSSNLLGSLAQRQIFVVHVPSLLATEYQTGATAAWVMALDDHLCAGMFR